MAFDLTGETPHPSPTVPTVRVLIVDEHAICREALRALLHAAREIEVVGEASNGWEALAKVAEQRPDVVLMDMRMPELDGVGAIRLLGIQSPTTKVLVFTTFDDDELVFDGLRAGAAGYLPKEASLSVIREAILAVAKGRHPFFQKPSARTNADRLARK